MFKGVRRFTGAAIAIVAGGILGACQTTEPPAQNATTVAAPADASEVLSADEMRAVLVGNTIAGKHDYQGSPYDYFEHYTADGQVEGSWHNPQYLKTETYTGTYEIRDGKFCSNDWCYRLRVVADGTYELVDSSQDFGEVRVLEGEHSFAD